MRNHRDETDGASGWLAKTYGIGLYAALATLILASCAIGPLRMQTPRPPTSPPRQVSATPSVTPRPTTIPKKATRQTPTATPRLATPVPPSPTPTHTPQPPAPAPSPTPLPPSTPAPAEPTIQSFRANVDVADPGDTITLTWHWSEGQRATIYHLLPTGQLSLPQWDVDRTGSLQYTISPESRNYDTFALHVYDEEGVAAQDTVQIELRCPDEWFFNPAPDICPASPPLVTDGAEEHFERGTMLWVGAEDRIYVLYDDGLSPAWSAYTDEWDEGEPTMDPTLDPPPGLQQPVRGFGLVWRRESTLRQRLGWATDQERGYQTTLQRSSHYRYRDLYIRALDSGLWKLRPNGSSWAHVSTQ